MARPKQNIPANENATQRFATVATVRVNVILKDFHQLSKLGDSKLYASSPEQRSKIKTTLETALTRALQILERGGETSPGFKL